MDFPNYWDYFLNYIFDIKNYFILLLYMPRKILYNSDDDDSIGSVDIQNTVVEKIAPIIKIEDPIIENIPIEKNISLKKPIKEKIKQEINCEYCKKSFGRQTILNKHINELRCNVLRSNQLKKEEELFFKQVELENREKELKIKIQKKEDRLLKKQNKPKEIKEIKEKIPSIQKEEKPKIATIIPPKYIINF